MMKSLYAVIFLLTFLISSAYATVIIEPLIGHNFGGKSEIHGGGSHYSGINGLGYGGRLSYQKLGFSLSADYLHSNLDMHDGDFGRKLNTNEFAGLVGFRFPILLKVYGGYILSANGSGNYQMGAGTSQSLKLNSGHGFKIGAGWTLFPLVDINLEYRSLQFDDYKLGGVKSKSNADLSAWMLSLSVPFKM
jgi:opacity protein-like surface antigen